MIYMMMILTDIILILLLILSNIILSYDYVALSVIIMILTGD